MLQINLNSYTRKNEISFRGTQNTAVQNIDFIITQKANSLVKKFSRYIEDVWADIKKNGIYKYQYPEFHTADPKTYDFVTIRPLYKDNKNLIYLEVESQKYIDRVIIDRSKPNNFSFEHSVITPHGSATLKTYNSRKERNPEIENKVSKYIEKYFRKVLPKSYGLNNDTAYFTKQELK